MKNANKDEYKQRYGIKTHRSATQCEHIHSHNIDVRRYDMKMDICTNINILRHEYNYNYKHKCKRKRRHDFKCKHNY